MFLNVNLNFSFIDATVSLSFIEKLLLEYHVDIQIPNSRIFVKKYV